VGDDHKKKEKLYSLGVEETSLLSPPRPHHAAPLLPRTPKRERVLDDSSRLSVKNQTRKMRHELGKDVGSSGRCETDEFGDEELKRFRRRAKVRISAWGRSA